MDKSGVIANILGAKTFGNLIGTHYELQNQNPPGPPKLKRKKIGLL
jgi:hypothetical protein